VLKGHWKISLDDMDDKNNVFLYQKVGPCQDKESLVTYFMDRPSLQLIEPSNRLETSQLSLRLSEMVTIEQFLIEGQGSYSGYF
jgi:hypothetical protein